MNEAILEIKETVAELMDDLLAEIHEKNQLLLTTQQHLLAQQGLTQQAQIKIQLLEQQLGKRAHGTR